MEPSSTDINFAIPPALPAILKGFARETLRAQVSRLEDINPNAADAAQRALVKCSLRVCSDRYYQLCCDLQPQDIYKFAAQYFKELHATSSHQTQPGFVGDETANLQANLLRMHFVTLLCGLRCLVFFTSSCTQH